MLVGKLFCLYSASPRRQNDYFCEAEPSINDNFAHERSECRQAIFRVLIKYRAHNKPPYKNLHFISGVIKIIFRTIKISLCTMYVINSVKRNLLALNLKEMINQFKM